MISIGRAKTDSMNNPIKGNDSLECTDEEGLFRNIEREMFR